MRSFHLKRAAFRSLKSCIILVRFWGWTENEREAAMDLTELRARAQQGLPLYGQSDQPEWVQQAAHSNSAFSQLKFCELVPSNSQNVCLFLCLQRRSPCPFSSNDPRISLIDTLGSTSSTTHIMVQTSLSIRSKCTGRGRIIYKSTLCLASVCVVALHPHPTARRSQTTSGQCFATLCRLLT